MAVTQYIGSRYVPLFSDPIEWSKENTYEALTIVLHEGNSYTSKQAVPKGIELDNEEYWAETGNYNAQVEQYRREAMAARDAADAAQTDIDTLLPKADFSASNTVKDYVDSAYDKIQLIQNEIKVISPYLQGTSVYLQHGDRALLFDCGDTTDNVRMENFLFAQKVNKLSCVVITHFDHDHWGAFATVAKYCDANTDIFIQMEPPVGTTNYTNYQTRLTEVLQIVQQYGLKTPRVPTEGEIVTYDDIRLELHNTTLDNRTTYEATPGEGYAWNSGTIGLNNYSLISIIDINNYVITYSGDLEAAGQRLNTQYMRKSALSFTPHHISGVGGYLPWWTAQSPERWLGTTAASTFGRKIYVNNRYLVKMLRYGYIDDVILTHNKPLEVEIINFAYNIISGESLVASIAEEGLDSCYTVLYQILPPSYESDNPWVLYKMSLQELVNACSTANYGLYTATTGLSGRNDMQIFKDLKALLNNSTQIETLTFSISTGRFLHVYLHSANTLYNELIVYGNVDVENLTGYRLVDTGKSYRKIFSTPIVGEGDLTTELTTSEIGTILQSRHAYVITSGGLVIWLNRSQSPSSAHQNMAWQGLTGFAFNTAMTNVYRVAIDNNGHVTAKQRTFDSSTLSNTTINSIGIM